MVYPFIREDALPGTALVIPAGGWHDDVGLPAEDRTGGPAVQPFGTGVPARDAAVAIEGHHGVLGRLDDRRKPRAGLAGTHLVGDVLADADHPQGLSVAVADHLALRSHQEHTAVGPNDPLDVFERLVIGKTPVVAFVDGRAVIRVHAREEVLIGELHRILRQAVDPPQAV